MSFNDYDKQIVNGRTKIDIDNDNNNVLSNQTQQTQPIPEECKRPRFKVEEFWMNDIKELIRGRNYTKFFPKYKTTRIEQLNAITRFSLYAAILILLFSKNYIYLYIPITIIVLVVIFYNINSLDKYANNKELDKILDIRNKERIFDQQQINKQFEHDGDKNVNLDIDDDPLIKNYDVEAGYVDSEGNIIVGGKLGVPKYRKNKKRSLFTVDEIDEFNRNTCRRPTRDNPFMNPDLTEFNNGDPPVACNSYDEDINDEMKINFNHELFRDVDELWERKNSQRQFYTVPNTGIPNNQTEFAEWLYKVPETCKQNHSNNGPSSCLRYEDLRFARHV